MAAMKVLSKEEAMLWCQAHGVALYWNLPDCAEAEFKFKIPSDAQARVGLVDQAMKIFANEHQFLVWFDDWAVWPSGQRMHVFDRFRLSYGITQRLIDSPGHLFDETEIEDAVSFVTLAVLFLWDCHIVVPDQRKQLYFSHDGFGLSKEIGLPGSERVPPFDGIRPHLLPIWSAYDRSPPAGDPIGCPVSVQEMVEYLRPMLPFSIEPANLEFIAAGQLDLNSYWLWAFYGGDGRRWNVCVFWQAELSDGRTWTWMCADNNPHDLSDHDYLVAMHNREY
jgi:hypothetical protein